MNERIYPQHKILVWLASQLVGVTENGANKGAMIERFQRAVDGVASGEPWCVGFVQHCVKEVDGLVDTIGLAPLSMNGTVYVPGKQQLSPTEWTIGLWHSTPKHLRRERPASGLIVVWQSLKDANKGHCGIISSVASDAIVTIEGNTSPGFGDQREGDGVWKKQRDAGGIIPGFIRLGYLSPWP